MYFTAHFHRPGRHLRWGARFSRPTKKRYKKELDAFTALGGESYFLLLNAMTRPAALNGAKIAQALAATKDFPGVTGSYHHGPGPQPHQGRDGDQGGPGAVCLSDDD